MSKRKKIKGNKKIKVSKNPNVNWKNDENQFARFIAEAEAAGAFDDEILRAMSESMDLDIVPYLVQIIDRAQAKWDKIKEQTR